MDMLTPCAVPPERGRRGFFTFQVCGTVEACPGEECATVGLRRVLNGDGTTSLDTSEWVRSLAYALLLTDSAKPASECGFTCGTRGGHWSDTFRGDGESTGTAVRRIPASCAVGEVIAAGEAELARTFAPLVTWKVATEVSVAGTYRGSNRFDFDVKIHGDGGRVVGFNAAGARLANGWLWGATSA